MQNMHLDASASDTWQSRERCFPEKTSHRFRGHSADKENFMKLLQFRINTVDEVLKKHFA